MSTDFNQLTKTFGEILLIKPQPKKLGEYYDASPDEGQ